ncbi:hypothetical protein Z517_06639 [Fonsecaea pedrosoi CBS 271.37]|uniref:Major facilitator superfamily (MFS) profile domain-containing protein n=1 Tax=Fonsecaea pedrosoi CBS 271.37 TaxID=1442368 RepID=A0A0D2H609_9EURO|nr:uncharacterized protein Z517_06639 [Fonsecaea pedrosoi CBS 271.37]KAH0841819.1 Sugar transporter family protein [Fonsecaea pedrosoi]KIW80024.1 hypothetical protein Z517_06639 [Fonsecaea pedrosoi CBS 271.37]
MDVAAHTKKQKINGATIRILAFVGFGTLSSGYSAAIIGTTLGQPSFSEYFELDKRSDATALISAMNGLFFAGSTIGVLIVPYISDRWGRKWAITVAAIVNLISGALLAGSVHVGMFLTFRFFAGASSYMLLSSIPLWISEVVPPRFRAALVDFGAVFGIIGYFIQGWIGYGFFFWKSGGLHAWRIPLALACPWPIFLLSGIYWLPESPRWLVMQDRAAEAKEIIYRLHADPKNPNNDYAAAEFYQINKQLAIDRTLGNSWMDMIRKPSYRKRCYLCIATAALIQCSGPLVINNYGPSIYKNLGFDAEKQLLYPAACLTLALGANIIGMFTVDLFSRPWFIGTGLIGCELCLIVEAALVSNFVNTDNKSALLAAVAMFFIFQLPYGIQLDGTQFSYFNEIFPSHLRAKGVSIGFAVIAAMNVMWLSVTPTAFNHIGWKYYLCFIIPGTLGAICIILFFPDTMGKPLEEIGALFGDEDEVAVYQRDIVLDANRNVLVDHAHGDDVIDDVMLEKEGKVHAEGVTRVASDV